MIVKKIFQTIKLDLINSLHHFSKFTFFKTEIFRPAGSFLIWYSSLKASVFVRSFLVATNSTGSLDLVYFEAIPLLCLKRRASRSLVTPQYKE